MSTRSVSGYRRRDGTRVAGYSQRYQRGDARAVAGGLTVGVVALLIASLHLLTALMQVLAAVALLGAGLMAGRAVRRHRRSVAAARRRRGRWLIVGVWRSYRQRRPPVRAQPTRTRPTATATAGTWVRRNGQWVRVDTGPGSAAHTQHR